VILKLSKEEYHVAKNKLDDPDEKKPELDWTDDEFYDGAWSWVDECELDEVEDENK
jgi:hypothetical protein